MCGKNHDPIPIGLENGECIYVPKNIVTQASTTNKRQQPSIADLFWPPPPDEFAENLPQNNEEDH
jgi:hypothetical protein